MERLKTVIASETTLSLSYSMQNLERHIGKNEPKTLSEQNHAQIPRLDNETR